jgi:hypothetical protein
MEFVQEFSVIGKKLRKGVNLRYVMRYCPSCDSLTSTSSTAYQEAATLLISHDFWQAGMCCMLTYEQSVCSMSTTTAAGLKMTLSLELPTVSA